jgi:hypothetical protein
VSLASEFNRQWRRDQREDTPILLLPIKAASVNMQEKIVFVIFDGKVR